MVTFRTGIPHQLLPVAPRLLSLRSAIRIYPHERSRLDPLRPAAGILLTSGRKRTHEGDTKGVVPDIKGVNRLLRRADIFITRRKFGEALQLCESALAAGGASAEVYARIGLLNLVLQRPQAACDALKNAVALNDCDATSLCNLGGALRELGRPEEARAHLETSLRLDPNLVWTWFNLGVVHADMAAWTQAVACQSRALQLAPNHISAAGALSEALLALGRLKEAEACARQAITLAPAAPEPHIRLANVLLASGRLKEGFTEYAWRERMPNLAPDPRLASIPPWQGERLAGRVLLVTAEQGFGDNLQMCRYVPLIEGASAIVLEMPRPLLRLLRGLRAAPETRLIVVEPGEATPAADLRCASMSLPLLCGTVSSADIPREVPYLHVPPDLVAAWQQRLGALDGLKAGLCWWTGSRHTLVNRIVATRRSIPAAALAPLADVQGCQFVSLQEGMKAPEAGIPLLDVSTHLADFAETAALVTCLDLVVTIDTAVAHLAGALNVPVWLLNRFDTDWRWSPAYDAWPWYPTLRQFRQREAGDWSGVIAQVTDALRENVSRRQA